MPALQAKRAPLVALSAVPSAATSGPEGPQPGFRLQHSLRVVPGINPEPATIPQPPLMSALLITSVTQVNVTTPVLESTSCPIVPWAVPLVHTEPTIDPAAPVAPAAPSVPSVPAGP